MKRIVIVFALLISAVSLTKAQGGGGGGRGPQGTPAERAQMTIDGPALTALNLTADQKAKTLALLTAMNKSTDSLRTAAAGDFQSMMPKMTAMSSATEAKFVSWLTADQKKAYDTALAAAKERNPNATGILAGGRGGRGGGGGAPGGGGR
jgi:hypothetical protein